MKNIRSFIAFKLPLNIITCLENTQQVLKKHGLDINWVRPRNIHLTVRFLGDIPIEMCQKIETAMASAAEEATPFPLVVKGLGVFPRIKNARVLWAGLGGEINELIDFQHTLETCLVQLGIKQETRPFKAHLTLGRIKRRVDPARLLAAISACGGFEPEYFSADHLILYQSDLKPNGAVYTPLYTKVLS